MTKKNAAEEVVHFKPILGMGAICQLWNPWRYTW
jgi:hypothetical protein